MLSEYVNDRAHELNRELREITQSRPRYERASGRDASRMREALRSLALAPAKATPGNGGALPEVVLRPATGRDAGALARLAEASERRLPSGLVLVAEVEHELVAALPLEERYVLSDVLRPTGDVVQLLELRSQQLRAARLEQVA
jgi:hypothetical protein